MRRALLLGLLGSSLGISACSEPQRFVSRDAGAASDGGQGLDAGVAPPVDTGPLCQRGVIYCAGNERYSCDALGNEIERTRCTAPASTCVAGRGCLVCEPNTSRCNPDDPLQIQTCNAEGTGFTSGARCNAADGETCSSGVCRGRCSESALGASYLGCDYWPVTLPNSGLDPLFHYALVLSNPQTYAVRATITGGALTEPRVVELMPGAVETVELPWVVDLVQLTPNCPRIGTQCLPSDQARSALRRNGAYHVQTNGPIAAYQFNPLTFSQPGGYYSYTNDASLLLPQGVLTRRYTVVTWPNFTPPRDPGETQYTFGGFVDIVAVTGESTEVTVTANANIRAGRDVTAMARGETRSFTLQPGDVLQLVGEGGGDLTGTTVTSSERVAVYVGHDCTNVPLDRRACDHLEEQLLPNETWGREYYVSGLRDRQPNLASVIRVVARTDNNRVTFDPPDVAPERTMFAGDVIEISTTRHFRIRGTGPLLVSQFMAGQGSGLTASAGDPAMVLEVPIEQYRSQYDFFVPASYTQNFINVVTPIGSRPEMDGQPLRGSFEEVAGYRVFTLPIAPGVHRLRAAAPDQAVGLKVYGIAPYTSYMYMGGLDLRMIAPG
ncbi:MAG: hypothetical protein JNK72_14685 [Myxococcales bacterium]|nr:hypothetical protein [Myxococcales bacterium]